MVDGISVVAVIQRFRICDEGLRKWLIFLRKVCFKVSWGWIMCQKTNHKLRAVYCSRCWPCPCRQTRSSNSCRKCATQAHGYGDSAPQTHFCWRTKSTIFLNWWAMLLKHFGSSHFGSNHFGSSHFAQVFPLKYRLGILICVPPSCGDHGLYDTGSTTSKTSFDVTTPWKWMGPKRHGPRNPFRRGNGSRTGHNQQH